MLFLFLFAGKVLLEGTCTGLAGLSRQEETRENRSTEASVFAALTPAELHSGVEVKKKKQKKTFCCHIRTQALLGTHTHMHTHSHTIPLDTHTRNLAANILFSDQHNALSPPQLFLSPSQPGARFLLVALCAPRNAERSVELSVINLLQHSL